MKKNLATFILCLITLTAFAQMPGSQSLGLIGTNADLSTGTAQMGVPLYTLKDGNFSVPIGLSYNASGIKVEDVASNVGLNWNLEAGGRIVRIVKDKPDEAFLGLDSRGWDACGTRWHYWGYKKGVYPTFLSSVPTEDRFYFLKDLEPDIFILNVDGDNIPFMITSGGVEKNGVRVILLNENKDIYIEYLENEYNLLQSPVEAEPSYTYDIDKLIHNYTKILKERLCNGSSTFANYSPNASFKVTFPNGTIYYFGLDVSSREYNFSLSMLNTSNFLTMDGHPEKKEKHGVAGTMVVTPSAWLLSKIVNPKGTIQPFNKYKTEDKFQEINFNYTRTMYIVPSREYRTPAVEHIADCDKVLPSQSIEDDYPLYLQAHLTSIESDNYSVKFNAPEIFALNGKVINLSLMVPDYKANDFTNTARKDVDGSDAYYVYAKGQKNIVATPLNPFKTSETIDNPLKPLPSAQLVRNMLVVDKSTGKKLGFYLDYGYYTEKNDAREVGTTDPKIRLSKRLKLNGVYPIEFGPVSSKLLNGYQFNYNPLALPDMQSAQVDYWGYYNGKTANNVNKQITYPKRDLTNMNTISFCSAGTADLAPDVNFAQAGVLTQITYPTGGNVKYEYELHDSDNYHTSKLSGGVKIGQRYIGGLRIKRIITFDPIANKEYIKKYTYTKTTNTNESSGFLSIWPDQYFVQLATSPVTTGIFFTDPVNSAIKYYPKKAYVSAYYSSLLSSRFINGNYITYREVKEEDITMVGSVEVANGSTVYEYNINEKQPYAILQNGQFSYDVDNPAVYGTCYNAYMYFNWNTPTYDFLKGTLKKVSVFKNGLIKPLSTTEYQYSLSNLTNVYNVKSAFLLPQTSIDVDLPNTYKGQAMVRYIGLTTGLIPNNPATALISIMIGIIDKAIALQQPFKDVTAYDDMIKTYNMPVGNYKLFKTINTDYDLSGNMPIQTTTTYGYGTSHNEPTSIVSITKNSDTTIPASVAEEKIENLFTYSRDYNTTSATSNEAQALKKINDRRFNLPVESITKKNNLVVDGAYMEYQNTLNYVGLENTAYGLELANPLSTFTLSAMSSGSIVKNANYAPIMNYTAYNTKGLPSTFNKYKAPSTQVNYGYNDILPNSITMASGIAGIAKTVSYEYDSPLFGIKKTTIPDGTFTTNEYDIFGRLIAVKDKNGNLIKSYTYNFATDFYANLPFDIILQKKSGGSFVDVKTLINNDSFQSTTGEFLNLKVNTGSVIKSIVLTLDNRYVYTTNFVNNSSSFAAFGTTGFDPSILGGGSQKIGSCNVQVKLYSDTDGKGKILGYKTLNFSIY